MIGRTISHYKITEKLGEGGMGEVYLADDTKLKRQVAIKFLPEHLTKDKENVERFEREAEAAAALNHPNIITIFDVIETDGQICIIMEYVNGDSLRTKIDKGISDIDEILNITKQICEGLFEAHKADIVHRDIKPENILIDGRGRVKILDFGLAKLKGVSKLTKESSTLGTIQYMSPEQIQGKEVDQRSDIFSLGVVLYELLTGEVPFTGDYESAVHYAILNEQPKLLKDIKAKYSFDIEKLLDKEPNKRLQSCREVLKELDNINIAGPKKTKPKNVYIVLRAVITTILIIATVFIIFFQNDEDKAIKSLAVLPLENLSNDPTQEYFVDGITDMLISELAQISALKVISRTSVMEYKGIHKSLTKIADELNVDAIVEGTVFSDGERVRISTQLIRAADDRHLWADKYEYDLKDIFNLQSEVAQAIAGAVEVQLTDHEEARLASVRNVDAEAYQLYLKGRYHWSQRIGENYQKCVEYFNKAIEKDSGFAEAYAGIADYYVIEPGYHRVSANVAYPKAETAALKALELDDKLAEAYTSLAAVRHYYDWAWSDAEKMYKKAIELNPNYGTAHQWYSELLTSLGNFSDAEKEIKLAQQHDPLSPIINTWIGVVFYFSRDYDRAIKHFQKVRELHPDFYTLYYWMSITYTQSKMHDEAIASAEKARKLSKRKVHIPASGYAYAMADRQDEAMELFAELKKLSDQELSLYPIHIAVFYIGLGEFDQAFRWLDIAYKEKDFLIPYINNDPRFDPLRSDPKFIEILKKMGLEK
jgi:serine/threonine protein kinase/Tfp pilus assembly protein PilF